MTVAADLIVELPTGAGPTTYNQVVQVTSAETAATIKGVGHFTSVASSEAARALLLAAHLLALAVTNAQVIALVRRVNKLVSVQNAAAYQVAKFISKSVQITAASVVNAKGIRAFGRLLQITNPESINVIAPGFHPRSYAVTNAEVINTVQPTTHFNRPSITSASIAYVAKGYMLAIFQYAVTNANSASLVKQSIKRIHVLSNSGANIVRLINKIIGGIANAAVVVAAQQKAHLWTVTVTNSELVTSLRALGKTPNIISTQIAALAPNTIGKVPSIVSASVITALKTAKPNIVLTSPTTIFSVNSKQGLLAPIFVISMEIANAIKTPQKIIRGIFNPQAPVTLVNTVGKFATVVNAEITFMTQAFTGPRAVVSAFNSQSITLVNNTNKLIAIIANEFVQAIKLINKIIGPYNPWSSDWSSDFGPVTGSSITNPVVASAQAPRVASQLSFIIHNTSVASYRVIIKYPLTLVNAQIAALTKSPIKILSAANAYALSMIKSVGKFIIMPARLGQQDVSSFQIKAHTQAVSAASAQAINYIRAISRGITIVSTEAIIAIKALMKLLGLQNPQTAFSDASHPIHIGVLAQQVVGLSHQLAHIFGVVNASTVALAKGFTKLIGVSSNSIVFFIRALPKSFSVASNSVVQSIRSYIKLISISNASSVRAIKLLARFISVASATVISSSRAIPKLFVITANSIVNIVTGKPPRTVNVAVLVKNAQSVLAFILLTLHATLGSALRPLTRGARLWFRGRGKG